MPQFLLDDETIGPGCNIVVTQPRRISAISISERVSAERCESTSNGNGRSAIGYTVRMESSTSPSTQILFLTPGVLLRKLQSSPNLEEYTHVIIDEIHERDKYTEFLMIALRQIMTQNTSSKLHLVLMSATIQTNELMKYWAGVGHIDMIPAEICVPGRTFPVQSFYLEDVLKITGVVSDENFAGGSGMSGGMDDLEADLAALLASKRKIGTTGNDLQGGKGEGGRGRGKMKKKKSSNNGNGDELIMVSENSLVCVMCGKGGFKCPEELGSHMGLCMGPLDDTNNDGGMGMTMVELEERVRHANVCTITTAAAAAGIDDNNVQNDKGEGEEVFEDCENDDVIELNGSDDEECIDDEDDDDINGIHHGKWDGESPFAVADVLNGSSMGMCTLTEEEMLNRYQMIHDDEQIDSELILEVLRYIHKSSYGDGAVLVFLPGTLTF